MSLIRRYPSDTHSWDREASAWVRLFDGRQWITATADDFLSVPESGVHGLRGSDHAALLLMFAPGQPRRDDVETLASGAEMTREQRAGSMARHDTCGV